MSLRPKALLVTAQYYPPQIGGISATLSRLVITLGNQNICCITGVAANSMALDNGSNVYRNAALFNGSRAKRLTAWVATLGRIMVVERPNLALLGSVEEGGVGLWLHDRLGFPLLVFAHGNEVLAALADRTAQSDRVFQSAERVITCSRYTSSLVERFGTAKENIRVIHPRCDSTFFRPRAVTNERRSELLGSANAANEKIILTVGNLVARKGHDLVIRALPAIKARVPSLLYVIAGDGPYRDALERLAFDVGVADCVRFLGGVSTEIIPELYSISDVFAMPSRSLEDEADVEGFGIVYLEANACGKPVIGGRAGGVPEAVLDGYSGLLVDPYSVEDVASSLIRLLTDKPFALRLGQQGRTRVVTDFSWNSMGAEMLAVFNEVGKK